MEIKRIHAVSTVQKQRYSIRNKMRSLQTGGYLFCRATFYNFDSIDNQT